MRTHVILPEELVETVDRLVGRRKRSRFVEDAVREKLEHERLGKALKSTAGILREDAYPEWSTSEKTAEWVRKSRELEDDRSRTFRERAASG